MFVSRSICYDEKKWKKRKYFCLLCIHLAFEWEFTFSCDRIFYIHIKYFIYFSIILKTLLFLLDIVQYIVVKKQFVNKGISNKKYLFAV